MIMRIGFHNRIMFCGAKPSYLINMPDIQQYIDSGRIKETDIKGVAGQGGLSVVLDLGDDVLKCSYENPLEFRAHNPSFDILFLSPVEKFGKTYFVREPKADVKSVTREDCRDVIRRLFTAGFEPSRDFDEHRLQQVGIYSGKPYLLDTRCAVPQPNRFSRFVYDFCSINKRVYFANTVDEFCFEHIDETPRPNLSFRKGLAKMWTVIRDNMKAGKKPFSLHRSIALFLIKK